MALVIGLRGITVGEDTAHYSIDLFDALRDISWFTVIKSPRGVVWSVWGEKIEVIFALLYKIVQIFTDEGRFFIFLIAVLTCFFFALFIYRSINDYIFEATYVFLCDSLFMGAFNGIRQMLALSVIVNAFEYVKRKDYKRVIIICVLACGIHISAIVFIPILLLFKIKHRKRAITIIACASALALVSVSVLSKVVVLILPRYAHYFENQYWTNSIRGIIIQWIVILGMVAYIYFTKIRNDYEFFGSVGAILYITAELLGQNVFAFGRLVYYFKLFLMMLFPAFGERISSKTKVVYYLMVGLLLFFEYFSYARSPARLYTI